MRLAALLRRDISLTPALSQREKELYAPPPRTGEGPGEGDFLLCSQDDVYLLAAYERVREKSLW